MEKLILKIALLVLVLWIYILDRRKKYCPNCGTQLDKAGNDYHCRNCRIVYHMNAFGKLKKR